MRSEEAFQVFRLLRACVDVQREPHLSVSDMAYSCGYSDDAALRTANAQCDGYHSDGGTTAPGLGVAALSGIAPGGYSHTEVQVTQQGRNSRACSW